MAAAFRRGAATRAVAGLSAGLGAVLAYRYQRITQREQELPEQRLSLFSPTDSTGTLRDHSGQNRHGDHQRVLIIGPGVVGVSTAYQLAKRGHEVVVLEPRALPGEECSACAAGGMSRQVRKDGCDQVFVLLI